MKKQEEDKPQTSASSVETTPEQEEPVEEEQPTEEQKQWNEAADKFAKWVEETGGKEGRPRG